MNLEIDHDLLARARKLGPLVGDHADEAEKARRPSPHVLAALREAGLFRLLTPASLGGIETDPVTCARVIEEVAGFDSAAGWALMVANSVDWWCARLPDEGPREIYAEGPDAVIAAAFHPPIRAVAGDGGYVVTGRNPLASNIHDADWLMFTAVVDRPSGDEGPPAIGLIVRAGEAEVIDTWYPLGMRGTDSNDVAVEGVFVPASRTFPLQPGFEPGSHYRGRLYRFPGMGEAAVVICPVALAVARRAVDELRTVAQGRTPFGTATVLRDRPVAQAALARAEALVRSSRLLFYDTLDRVWARTGADSVVTLEEKADLALAAAHSTASAVEAVDLVWSQAGSTGIYARNRLERHFRDVHTLQHHGFVSPARYETAGQVYLGVEPEFGLVAF